MEGSTDSGSRDHDTGRLTKRSTSYHTASLHHLHLLSHLPTHLACDPSTTTTTLPSSHQTAGQHPFCYPISPYTWPVTSFPGPLPIITPVSITPTCKLPVSIPSVIPSLLTPGLSPPPPAPYPSSPQSASLPPDVPPARTPFL